MIICHEDEIKYNNNNQYIPAFVLPTSLFHLFLFAFSLQYIERFSSFHFHRFIILSNSFDLEQMQGDSVYSYAFPYQLTLGEKNILKDVSCFS